MSVSTIKFFNNHKKQQGEKDERKRFSIIKS